MQKTRFPQSKRHLADVCMLGAAVVGPLGAILAWLSTNQLIAFVATSAALVSAALLCLSPVLLWLFAARRREQYRPVVEEIIG